MFKDANSKLQASGLVSTRWKSYFWGKNFLSNKEVMDFFKDNQVASVSSSKNFTLILDEDGKAFGFGFNEYGGLGIGGAEKFVASPTPVKTELRFKKVVAGFAHSLFLSLDGNLYGCGCNNAGQVTGEGEIDNLYHPSQVNILQAIFIPGLAKGEKIKDCGIGNCHTLILTDHGRVFAWGYNLNGQLGLGHKITDGVIHEVTSLKEITSIATQGSSSFCMDDSGNVYAWGRNDMNQLGFGDSEEYLVPTQIKSLKDKIETIHSGYAHTAMVTKDGQVLVFGDTTEGQCGLTGESTLVRYIPTRDSYIVKKPTPVSIPNEEIQSVLLGHNYTLYLTNSLNLYGCGNGTTSYLGEDNIKNKKIINPVKINKFVETLSYDGNTIKETAHNLFLAYLYDQKNPVSLGLLPLELLVRIAAFTGGKSAIQDPEGSMQIAVSFFRGRDKVVSNDNDAKDKRLKFIMDKVSSCNLM